LRLVSGTLELGKAENSNYSKCSGEHQILASVLDGQRTWRLKFSQSSGEHHISASDLDG